MRYYKKHPFGNTTEISKTTFYRLAKRSDAFVDSYFEGGKKAAKVVTIKED